MGIKNKLKRFWKKKLTKLVIAVALIATGNEFLGYPLLQGLMTEQQQEKVIEIESTSDSEIIKQINKEVDK